MTERRQKPNKPEAGRFDSSPAHRFRPGWRPGFTWGERLGVPECPYMRRWVLNLGPLGSIRLHRWHASDDHRAFHDHSWWFVTLVLKGGYTDISPQGRDRLRAGSARFRRAHHRHTVEVDPGGATTLMVTGPWRRKWLFWALDGSWHEGVRAYFRRFGHPPCDG